MSSIYLKQKKIAISGTSCSGKTTLVTALEDMYSTNSHVVFVEEVARQYFLNNPMSEEERFNPSTQERILDQIVVAEKQASNSLFDLVICDNSIVATAAFTAAIHGQELAERMLQNNREWIETYNFMYVLDPSDVKFQNDDIRKESVSFRNEVYSQFLRLLHDFKIKHKIISGSVEQRLKIIYNDIENHN